MTGTTHMIGALLAGSIYTSYVFANGVPQTPQEASLLLSIAAIGGLIPDIDSSTSKLGRRIKPVSKLISKIFGHRGLFHAPILYIILFSILYAKYPEQQLRLNAALIGIASHLAIDMLNPSGIPLLYPIKWKFHIMEAKAGGIVEYLVQGFCSLAALYVIFHYGLFQTAWKAI